MSDFIENIAKCAIGWNQNLPENKGVMEFDKRFLELYSKFKIEIVEETATTFKVRIVPK